MDGSSHARQPAHGDLAASIEKVDPQRRLAFLEMDEADAERLRGMAADFRERADEFVEIFYQHLFAFESTAKFLQSPETVARLKGMQRRHLESMLEADWNDAYFEQRRLVGHVHAEVGIESQYFLGAYNKYLQYSFARLAERRPSDVEGFRADAVSLLKAVLLDIGLTLDAYFVQSTINLRQALDMFWRANAELRQFAQLTSHDLKTPLATVANLCDEALDEFGDQMPEPAKELIAAARNRTYRMSKSIDELLASALPDANEPSQTVSSQEALDEALDTTKPVLAASSIEVAVHGPLPLVRGNKIRLREAFANILSNAAKFIDRRPGKVTIDAQERDGQCVIRFADNGPGIPREELDRLFGPFRRLPRHRDRPGSGLGLYFTRNLIVQQGGRIWAESTLGQGSTFCIQLPRAEAEGQAKPTS